MVSEVRKLGDDLDFRCVKSVLYPSLGKQQFRDWSLPVFDAMYSGFFTAASSAALMPSETHGSPAKYW